MSGNVLMIEESDTLANEMLLQNEDYPNNYINMAHPDDYIVGTKPTEIELIYHEKPKHSRLILRINFQIDGGYIPMSFVCDTGAPRHMYLCEYARNAIKSRIKIDDSGDQEYIRYGGGVIPIDETPFIHNPSNIIGLKLMIKWGVVLSPEEPYFRLTNPPNFI